ncbi:MULTISPECIES: phosphate signaling complex protein PhoU [Halorubrum]|uniref:Phosphate-specific transport system accessory protein PhoU n=1 Tax=Halorubrum sodomense TaxID=35743 RepID=A0A1I6G1Q7_HALSD|nr:MULTISPECIES: phosphate signaling complex protein PhoU [Halorubrum]TKX53926.1 phosphate signaling complex protein PhoU [Halorubrum sp. SP3]TKX70052.1 phosphate signaling complex protein PhoU [Halorubrum sp. SP9]SFR36116.1 phosphate transport system protein [Halorubrum sodomense]
MPRENYQERLDELRDGVVAMGETVCGRLDDAVEAAVSGDDELARSVIESDHEVNETYLALEDECTELLALQQPVAGDLRLVAASFKIITDLERVADLATNLAAYGGPEGGVHPAVDVRDLGDGAREMVADAVAAYAARDPDACREIAASDDAFDERCREASEAVVRELLEADRARNAARDGAAPTDGEALEASLDDVSQALLAVRDLERIADHAVNVAARTLYMIENDDELIY